MGDSLDDLEQRAAVAEGQLLSRKWKCRKKKLDPATLEAVLGLAGRWEEAAAKCRKVADELYQSQTGMAASYFERASTLRQCAENLRAAVEKGEGE